MAKQDESSPQVADTFPVYLGYDVWIDENNRVTGHGLNDKGEISQFGDPVRLPVELAKAMIREGKAVRGDPMPV